MRLTWQSKMLSGSTTCPEVDRSQWANCDLAARLARRNSARKAASLASHFSPAISLKSVIQSSPIALLMTSDSAGFAISSQRRGHAVGLVVEPFREHLCEIADRGRPQQSRMNGGDTGRRGQGRHER